MTAAEQPTPRWRFCIDAGGTFTDVIGVAPDGRVHVVKVLSGPRAPLEGIESVLQEAGVDTQPWPAIELRMGTTAGTNALLERRGAPTLWVTNAGFEDLLEIGDQRRPDLFALEIHKDAPLPLRVAGCEARAAADGRVLVALDPEVMRRRFEDARAQGLESAAIGLIHAARAPELELELEALAREAGFAHVSISHRISHSSGWLARAETTVVDAYLNPVLSRAVGEIQGELTRRCVAPPELLFMQSSGGLAPPERFRGRDCVMSGPAGGVVAVGRVARALGLEQVIGFDMGGTSTDVCRWAGRPERRYESRVAGIRIRTPMLELHTVAAGGGSICSHAGARLTVGPESAGSQPGPLCYGRPGAGPLTITDLNLQLGRLVEDNFPFPLQREVVGEALDALDLAAESGLGRDALAAGLLEIADEAMAAAIRRITIARGHDAREHDLVVFGGAGGQHACRVAARLGIHRVVHPPLAGVLSAWGIGMADQSWHGQREIETTAIDDAALGARLDDARAQLEAQALGALGELGEASRRLSLELGYHGTPTSLEIESELQAEGAPAPSELRAAFERLHTQRFGYARSETAIELRRVHLNVEIPVPAFGALGISEAAAARERRRQALYTREGWREVPILERASLDSGAVIEGPALIVDATGTFVLEADWRASLTEVEGLGRCLVATHEHLAEEARRPEPRDGRPDPVALELYLRRFDAIATEMGVVLERTASSTNIRDRRDFSCAVFDASGELVANAPYIPVHLGAMSETVRAVAQAHPDARPGDVFASNDPAAGGSHLPDITVVSPLFDDAGQLRCFVASRGHHADVGGITPGSMPPHSTRLDEEGVVLRALPIVVGGEWQRTTILEALGAGPHPCRKPLEVLGDLEAQVAANRRGVQLLEQLFAAEGDRRVAAYMQHIQDHAAELVRRTIAAAPDGVREFDDALDDGTRVHVRLEIRGDQMLVDLRQSGDQHPGNFNAPVAVSVAALLYVLRVWVGARIPLNAGCMRAVELKLRPGSLLHPSPDAAVVAGNVETSQRVVDVLLGALGLAAASQGTMNNLSFGTTEWGYYETLGGGSGATANADGASAVHTHMTNTRLTDVELLERDFPVRLLECGIRRGSGGAGRHRGGDGMIRVYAFDAPVQVSFSGQRRRRDPFGLAGGSPGQAGAQWLDATPLPESFTLDIAAGQTLRIETPGGGGHGPPR